MAKVVLTDEAREDLRDLDNSSRRLCTKALKKLEDEPEKRGAPLGSRSSGNLTTFRKLVVGDRQFRIIYQVLDDGTVVVVWVVGPRADEKCYAMAVSRLETARTSAAVRQELRQLLDMAFES